MENILRNDCIAPLVYQMEVTAPEIAKRRKAGQFIILRPRKTSERIPLTIAGADAEKGTITLIYQVVGKTTADLSLMKENEKLVDIAGPLGKPTHIEKFGTVVCVGGGIGIAPILPIAKALKEHGNRIISILGVRSKDLMILENEMRGVSDEVIITTDDGTYGMKGFVTDALKKILDSNIAVALVVAIGPPIMMKMVSRLTKQHDKKTIVSLNTIMVDGTGMCGGCRVTVGTEVKFVCVDGPEFDGHLVDYDEMMKRLNTYVKHEKESFKLLSEKCKLTPELMKVKNL